MLGAAGMRQKVLAQLYYPRTLIGYSQDLDRCPHNGMYDHSDHVCLNCSDQSECIWLYNNKEFSNLKTKPLADLRTALAFATDYVSAQIAIWEHDSDHCPCEACSWLRQAEELCDASYKENDSENNQAGSS